MWWRCGVCALRIKSCTASSDDPVKGQQDVMLYMEWLYKEPYGELQQGTIMGPVSANSEIFLVTVSSQFR